MIELLEILEIFEWITWVTFTLVLVKNYLVIAKFTVCNMVLINVAYLDSDFCQKFCSSCVQILST